MKAAISLVAPLCTLSLACAKGFDISETDEAITITKGDKTVLVYHKAEVPPPKGADPRFRRSGFIHPLCAPSGEPVTGIHPDDHVHHIGLWGAWVNTVHGSRKPDFWNLKKDSGRVRFKETSAILKQADAVGFTVLQEYVSLADGKDPIVVLNEQFTIKVREAGEGYLVDHTTVQTNVTDTPLEFPAYRYGGPIAYRGPAHWDKNNSTVLTSEGKSRTDGHATRGRWCLFSGPVAKTSASLAILCHPENHDAPQRMRIWPPKSNNGAVFFNYVPVQEHAWSLKPGKPSTMRYRLILHDGNADATKIDAAWKAFAATE